jgi:hypothetical protein
MDGLRRRMKKRSGIRKFFVLCFLGISTACRPAGLAPENSFSLTDLSAGGASEFPGVTATASDTLTPIRETDTPSPSATRTRLPTETALPYPTPWPEGFTPTVRPTPTRGLAPTATLGAMQSCPAPTQASVAIRRLDNPADYEQTLLDQLAATGELNSFRQRLTGGGAADAGDTQVALLRAEVNNDSVEESVISIRQPYEAGGAAYGAVGRHYRTAVFILGCRDRRYALLHLLILDRAETDLPSGLLAVEDLNANGVKEIVISTVENTAAGGGQNLFAKVLEWDGGAFRELLFPESGDYFSSNTLNAPVDFRDIDGNGTREILVPRNAWTDGAGVDCGLGPDRNSSAVWMWDGDLYRYMWREFAAPHYRFQAAYDGDYYSYLGLFRDAETMYLRAVFDSSLKPGSSVDWGRDGGCPLGENAKPDSTEPQRIQAYARFRLVELFVRVGRVLEAQTHWNELRARYPIGAPGHIYSYLANAFWWEYSKEGDVSAACAAVRQEAQKNEKETFGLFASYGELNPGPTADTICPFSSPAAEE